MNQAKQVFALLWTILAGLIAGCATPDLQPFADATSAMAGSTRKAGEIARSQLQRGEAVRPTGANSLKDFDESWKVRREALDHIEAYATSLAALGTASANAKANMGQAFSALKTLASKVPGYGEAFNAANDLVISIGQSAIELKAYRDMSQFVSAADPIVQSVVTNLDKDLRLLKTLYHSQASAQLRAVKDQAEPSQTYYRKLAAAREGLRKEGAEILANQGNQEKLTLLDKHIAVVEPEVKEHEKRILSQAAAMENGLLLFEEASETLKAWGKAHGALHVALTEKRMPDFGLLIARAQELRAAAENLRRPQTQTSEHQP